MHQRFKASFPGNSSLALFAHSNECRSFAARHPQATVAGYQVFNTSWCSLGNGDQESRYCCKTKTHPNIGFVWCAPCGYCIWCAPKKYHLRKTSICWGASLMVAPWMHGSDVLSMIHAVELRGCPPRPSLQRASTASPVADGDRMWHSRVESRWGAPLVERWNHGRINQPTWHHSLPHEQPYPSWWDDNKMDVAGLFMVLVLQTCLCLCLLGIVTIKYQWSHHINPYHHTASLLLNVDENYPYMLKIPYSLPLKVPVSHWFHDPCDQPLGSNAAVPNWARRGGVAGPPGGTCHKARLPG